MSTLKARKEEFVTGLSGGSIEEINVVTSVALTSYFCWNLLNEAHGDNELNIFVDFALNWIALLFSITIYSNNIRLLTALMVVPCLVMFIYYKSNKRVTSKEKQKKPVAHDEPYQLVRKPYISAYRSGMLILTCLAIIAVDFPIFPRRFAKVETWGTSLMDLGVGSFVFSNGLVSSRRLMQTRTRIPILKRLIAALRSSSSLLVLGLLRLYFVKNLEYQEHVTEYGVHWNFFITLSFLPIVLVFIDPIADYIPRFVIALVLSGVYDWKLVKDPSFLKFLILEDRDTLFKANREGIFSFIGYCAIFLWGQSTGFYLLGNVPTVNNLYKNSTVPVDPKKKLRGLDKYTTVRPLSGLLIWSAILITLDQFILAFHPHDVSRRFANLPYTIWVVAYNVGFLTIYCAVDQLFGNYKKKYKLPVSLEAMNSNGLVLFLLSNVTTGLINMSFSTIDTGDYTALLTLVGYAAFLAIVSTVLYKRRIFIRL